MPSSESPKPKAGASADPNASLVWMLGRLPYRSNLKVADIKQAVRHAREVRLAAKRQKSEY
jgi:hypothetical protein